VDVEPEDEDEDDLGTLNIVSKRSAERGGGSLGSAGSGARRSSIQIESVMRSDVWIPHA
jgi:hypothetical protein